ncbi:carbohydrate ABC transporter permease [Cohnella nanjingensis]|uniref:Sugar ABC transporter permease n=1 Tax=Cohnella nanjingensis TaxID=1387779 RepID=A0A7X0RRN5_9BACL|nr:sugar ABC transporter permease [Cohnella nanjingensis]MBB6671266.1 sugar ABC transporter permease [Cohnella nanjingensis]
MRTRQYSAYLYIAPIMAFFLVFLLYPLLYTFRISLFEWNGIDKTMNYIGLANYRVMFNDPVFWQSMRNFVTFAVLVVGIQMILGFLLAYSMRRPLKIFTAYKTIIFVPVILTPIVVSYVFTNLLAYNGGLLNESLRTIGLDFLAAKWLGDPRIALFSIVAITVWAGTGFSMSVYVSSMTSLPNEVLEASRIDGASRRQTMVKVVWPMLRDTHFSLTIIGAISALKIFDIIYLLTRGGPVHATEMPSTYMFNSAFVTYEQGYASAVAGVMILFAMTITIFQLRLSRGSAN